MSDPDVSLEPATPTDLDRVERLLAANVPVISLRNGTKLELTEP